MLILALETTAVTGSVALLEGDHVVAELALPPESRSAQSLAPAIRDVLAQQGWTAKSLQLVAVAQGPGSFTGLRVGITTAKTLAYAINAEVLGIDTLEVLANQGTPVPGQRIHTILDAQRNQLFAASFVWETAARFATRITATHIADLAQWLAQLAAGDQVIGPALEKVAGLLPAGVIGAAAQCCFPQAATIGRLAYRDFVSGRRDDLWKLAPHYHRLSAAEEKAAK